MNEPKTQEQILEEKRDLCAARTLELSTLRLSNAQLEAMADDALNAQVAAIQEKIGVLSGDFAAVHFGPGGQRDGLVEYIKAEKINTFRELIEPEDDKQKAEFVQMLNRLVSMQVKGHEGSEPVVFVGYCSNVIQAAFAHYGIHYEHGNRWLNVWKPSIALADKRLYSLDTSFGVAGVVGAPECIFLIEAAIIHASAEENEVIWRQLKAKTPAAEAEMIDFLLETQSGMISHSLGQHIDSTKQEVNELTPAYVCLNPLQNMLNLIQDDVIDDLARLESMEPSKLPYVKDRNGKEYVRLDKLSCRQKVHAIDTAINSGKFTLVGEAMSHIMEATAGDKNTFLMVSAGNASTLNPFACLPEKFERSDATVNLDW